MRRHWAVLPLLLASTALASAEPVFNRIATFAVADNMAEGADAETSSEIIAASEDGNMLVYSDSPLGVVGFIDITDPRAPRSAGTVAVEGEPTSVVVAGGVAFAAVNTSESFSAPSGKLLAIDLATRQVGKSCDLGGQPDSVALAKDGSFLAVAIENERDEEVNEGDIPQLPGGDLKIVPLADGVPDCAAIRAVALAGVADVAGDDPEPEFAAVNGQGEIALTLQENNHIVVVDGKTGEVRAHFSAGSTAIENVDTEKDGRLDFSGRMDETPREPDAVKWLGDDRLVTANEGDWKGGTRGFTIFSDAGEVLFESRASLEQAIARAGHYPEKRNKKGVEPEGIETGTFGDKNLFFVAAERANLVAVYEDTGTEPRLLQLLPSGIGPEGMVAIPSRNLLVTANEADLAEDGGARSHVMIYERAEGAPVYPMVASADAENGMPIGWGALSGLAADAKNPGQLWAVSDSVYSGEPAIFRIDAGRTPALITAKILVTRNGAPAEKLDLEGIAPDGEGGFWLASEGDAEKEVPHALLRVDADGAIREEIPLPAELVAGAARFGLEGVTVVGEGDARTVVGAVQRAWKDDPENTVKLVAFKPSSREWSAVRYPLETTEKGWVGLSEISAHDGRLLVVERDNLLGADAKLKRLYSVPLDGFEPAPLGGDLPLVEKTQVRDLLGDLKAAANGFVPDKLEGFTVDAAGEAFAVTDNDGVDDAAGETLFLRLGPVAAMN